MNLYEVFANVNGKEEFEKLFADLCTYQEIENMQQRIECAQLLMAGETYSEVIKKTEISSATLSRVSRCLRHGAGGYSDVLARIVGKEE